VEVQRFLERQPMYPKDPHGEVHYQRAAEMLAQPFYSGYITDKKWCVELQPGKHKPLIPLATGRRSRIATRRWRRRQCTATSVTRFPFAAYLVRRLSRATDSLLIQGCSARYPYFLCDTRGFASYRKSIRREKIEGKFEELLKTLKPSQGLFHLAFEMFRDLWNNKLEGVERRSAGMRQELATITRKVDLLLERLVETTSETVLSAYERKIKEYETEKAVLSDNLSRTGKPMKSFGETYRTAFDYLANCLAGRTVSGSVRRQCVRDWLYANQIGMRILIFPTWSWSALGFSF
jgi:site-specific DNA recombinase